MNKHLLRSPFFGDFVFAALGIALTLGWLSPISLKGVGCWAAGGLLVLWAAEHLAFAKRMRASLLRVHLRMPHATEQEFAEALPGTHGTVVGHLMRSALRMFPFFGGWMALGLAQDKKGGLPTHVLLPLVFGEVLFAMYWMMCTIGSGPRQPVSQGRPATTQPKHHAPPGSWLARQIERARRSRPAAEVAAEFVLLVWSSLLFSTIANAFAQDMARWPDRGDTMPPVVLTAFMVFATWMLALVVHIPLHLDMWLERAWSASTRRGRWQLRLSAWCAMAMGLGPAWVAWWRYMWA